MSDVSRNFSRLDEVKTRVPGYAPIPLRGGRVLLLHRGVVISVVVSLLLWAGIIGIVHSLVS